MSDEPYDFGDEPVEENPVRIDPKDEFEPLSEQDILDLELQLRGFGV
jgi:hypothetical protein